MTMMTNLWAKVPFPSMILSLPCELILCLKDSQYSFETLQNQEISPLEKRMFNRIMSVSMSLFPIQICIFSLCYGSLTIKKYGQNWFIQ